MPRRTEVPTFREIISAEDHVQTSFARAHLSWLSSVMIAPHLIDEAVEKIVSIGKEN